MPHVWLPIFLVAPLSFSVHSLIEESVGMDSLVDTTSTPQQFAQQLNPLDNLDGVEKTLVDTKEVQTKEIQKKEVQIEKLQSKKFQNLESAADFYQQIVDSGQWQTIDSGPMLSLGDTHPQITQLRKLLHLYGDLDKGSAELEPLDLFDRQLQQALIGFQTRHGAKVDGVLGPKTRQLLNISPQQRLEQLFLNNHRQRLYYQKLDRQKLDVGEAVNSHYLQINIPEYRLRVYNHTGVILEMKTIIGRPSRQTPTFSTEVKSLVINPSWNVPRSIAYRDILPRWRKDKTYLARNNLKVIAGWTVPKVFVPDEQIDPDKMYRTPEYHRLWEPPGTSNTLGRIKFQLSAGNSIYLHDTKKPQLFESHRRAKSSGCIRLEKPFELADLLLQQSQQWPPEQLHTLLEEPQTHNVRLDHPIPVHITYWTAWLDGQGYLYFADDLYYQDPVDFAQLKEQLQQLVWKTN